MIAAKHGFDAISQLQLIGQGRERSEHRGIDPLTREVQHQTGRLVRELPEALRVACKQVPGAGGAQALRQPL